MSIINFNLIKTNIASLEKIIELRNQRGIIASEAIVKAEALILKNNMHSIIELAKNSGDFLISTSALDIPIASLEQAYVCRYLMAPLLYKLGMSHDAAKLRQNTFEYLFPNYHEVIYDQLCRLLSVNWENGIQKIVDNFAPPNEKWHYKYRIKSIDSIWRNMPDLNKLKSMEKGDFLHCVNDFIGLRWVITPEKGESRLNAIINGAHYAPRKYRIGYRNQYLKKTSGFSEEPVIKLTYIIEPYAIELQILGGDIEYYMSGKGYSDYKTGLSFPPRQSDLSISQWHARLGTLIAYKELKDETSCRRLLLQELCGNTIHYDEANCYYEFRA